MTFRYLGKMKESKEIMNEWAGAIENYRVSEKNGKTKLNVEIDITDKQKGFFQEISQKH